ncbi:uncharacterized protein tasor2 isoform X3 [Alosa sapidissima]|uniref:uncharacterized protein tasor2 isoform X3 n=1 Tax=Alosa sapidissima TaxID=34773 RepID=UPI001C088E29|nr:uncharacterized protein tasor2 isoform X3 [Alosa sapidissima]
MENDIGSREGLLEPVLPGSAIFDDSILPPLHNSYLYEESRNSFIYSSAHLINNDILQKRYTTFRVEKKESGYTEEELEESFGFLLFEDESKANTLGDSGLLTGHSSCSTLGDPSKGVYVSKYSDCLDVKRWYCGKSGYIAIVRLTKGRVKEMSDNYTVNFTPPTEGFDCHESDQLSTVTATTSSFLAFERTQHYMYELLTGGKDTEKCPRHVCPFAIVAFSYGKAHPTVPESSEKSQEKTVFYYQPWTGQLVVDSLVYEIGLKSSNGALLPAKLPKTLKIKTVMRVSDLRMLLPKDIFETCFSGEVMVGGKCCTLFEVVSTVTDDNLLSILTEEVKEKDMALVFQLDDAGFFVLLHSSYFLSYEDANSEKKEALQGMFIFPDSRTIQRDTKSCRRKSPLSSEVLQVLPALNYAETEMEKSGPGQHEKITLLLEKHLEHYGTLIHPGLQSSPQREASMFPDQYDVPYVFKHLFPTPKWTEVIKLQVRSYLDQPCSFEFSVKRATELLLAGREQRRDDPDDEVYYCISSPEESPRSPTVVWLEKPSEADASCPTDTFVEIQHAAEQLSESCEPESPPESIQPELSDLSKLSDTEILSKGSIPALKTLPTTLGFDLGETTISMEITPPTAAVVTTNVLTSSFPKECDTVNSCDDQALQMSAAAQEVVTNESRLPISSKTNAPLEASDAKIVMTEPDVHLGPEIKRAPSQTDWRSLPRRRGRKRKRISKTSVSKMTSVHSSSLSPGVATKDSDGQCMGAEQNQPDTEKDQSILLKLNSEDKPSVDQVELPSSTSECWENSNSPSQEKVENISFEADILSKTNWKSLPRRCRKDQDGQTDVPKRGKIELLGESSKETTQIHPMKRKMERESLRYGLKTIVTDCGRIFVPHGSEVPNKDLDLVVKRQKTADGESGLKKTEVEVEESISLSKSLHKADSVDINETINADLVPKVNDKQDSLPLTKETGATTKHSEESPDQNSDTPCQTVHTSPTFQDQQNTGNESSSAVKIAADETQLTDTEKVKEAGSTEPSQKKKKRATEYTIISISQLRTVLRRGKKDSDSAAEKGTEGEKTESKPNSERPQGDDKNKDDCKSNSDSVTQGYPDQKSPAIPTTEDSEQLQPSQKPQSAPSSEQEPSDKKHLEPSIKLSEDLTKQAQIRHVSSDENVPLPKKASPKGKKRANSSRKGRKGKAKDVFKENERLNSDTPSSQNTEQLKQAHTQTGNDSFTGHGLEEPCVGLGQKSCSVEGVVNALCMPADALTLLADIALSGRSGKHEIRLQNLGLDSEGKLGQRRGTRDGVKECGSQVSVLHSLLRDSKSLKIPIAPRSPLPKGLVMKGECVVFISKDHSYSQPSSLVLGLSGAHLQALPFRKSTDSLTMPNSVELQGRPLNTRKDWILLQRQPCVNRNGLEQQSPIKKLLPSNSKEMRKCKRRRQIVEKDGSIKVTRLWREQYDFSLDSKFTNDPHDKAVTRALHGPWNVNIVDSPEEVHLIFHMWIGLFYSRSASRFFHIDPVGFILQDGGHTKLPEEVELHSTASFSKSDRMNVSSQKNTSLKVVPSPLPANPGVLNLSDKTKKTSTSASEVLDLSVKGCTPLNLTFANTKTRETFTERPDPQYLDLPMSEIKSRLVSTNTNCQLRVNNAADSTGNIKRDNISVHGIQTKSHNTYENASNTKPSSTCASESSGYGNTQQATNIGSDFQDSSDVQKRLDGLPGTKELTHGGSSAPVVQLNSSDEIVSKEDTISSQMHYSSAVKSTSPKHTENIFACGKFTTVCLDNESNVCSNHSSVVTSIGLEPVKIKAKVQDKTAAVETAAAVDDQHHSKVDTIVTVQDMDHSKDATTKTEQNLSDSNSETIMIVQDPEASKEKVILAAQCPSGSKVKMVQEQNVPCTESIMSVHDLNDVHSDAMVVDDPSDCEVEKEVPMDSEVQPFVTEHNHNETKPETTVTVQAQAESEMMAVVNMDQNDSTPSELVEEGELINSESETQVELDNLNTAVSTSEENNSCSEDATMMDLSENSVQMGRTAVCAVNENEGRAPMEVQLECNLKCEISAAGNESQVDTGMEVVEKIDHENVEHEILPEVTVVKACSHEGNVKEDLTSTMEQNEQINQSRSIIVGETEDMSSTEIAEMPHGLEEQQKTNKIVNPEAVSTSSQIAHDSWHITKDHELKVIENEMRCPTPTIDELHYNTMGTGSALNQCSTPTQDELPSDCGSAVGEQSFHEPCSDPYDNAVYNTEGLDLAALSHMITWFRNRNNKQKLDSVSGQNSEPSQLRFSTNSDSISSPSKDEGNWTFPNSACLLNSIKGFSGSSSDDIESNMQSAEFYRVQYEDVAATDPSKDVMFQSSADGLYNAMEPYTRDSKSTGNLSFRYLSKSASQENFHSIHEDSTGKDEKEKRSRIYREGEIIDTESVSASKMKDKQQEKAYWKYVYSNEQKHSSGSHCQQRGYQGYIDNFDQTWHWNEEEDHESHHYRINSQFFRNDDKEETSTSSQSSSTSSSESELESSSCNESFMRKREGLRVTVDFKRGDSTLSGHETPIFTVLGKGEKQRTAKNCPRKPTHSRTIHNPCHKGTQRYVEKFLQKWDDLHQADDDITQSSMDLEYLVFSDKMNNILQCCKSKRQQTLNMACKSPVTIQFSSLNEQDTSEEICDSLPMFSESKIKVVLPDRKERRAADSRHMPLRLQRLSYKKESEAACSKISAITAECTKSYYAMMKDVCTNKNTVRQTDRIKKKQDSPKIRTSKPVELCGKIKEDLFERLHDDLNSVVRQACKTKYRFFILVTSEDPFFRETKDLLENEGHISVEPDQFDLETNTSSSPLLIILRNEDIASHICEVPHLLELKKSSSVIFAGIDQPDDFVNLTHQELFGKGGFVVFDGTALNKLTLENMKKIVVFLEKLSKKGKWKWFLHYRDSRRFRENARSHQDGHDRKHFLDCCQEAGIVEVLPYHECDVISRDQPNYLHCLVRLQVQNATTRYPVFVSDAPCKSFEKNGILTMNMNTFLQILSNDSCTIC